jgi:uridine phosphorylase
MFRKPSTNEFLRQLPENDWGRQIRKIAYGWMFEDVPPSQFPKTIVLPLENPDLYEEDRFVSRLTDPKPYRAITVGTFRDRRVGVLKSKFGAPAVAMTVELLAAAGVRTIVGVGFCGGLQADIDCGDIVLPLAAVRNDGVTAHYVPPMYPAVADLISLDFVRELAANLGRRWHCGIVWSTDALLLETTSLVNEWSGHGVIAVDMETSALFTLARLCGVRAVAVLVASDNPAACRATDPGMLSDGVDAAVQIGLEFAASIKLDPL